MEDNSEKISLASSSSFCRRIYSEIEEVGWEHLVKLGDDLTFLSFRVMDIKGRSNILEITLDKSYPMCPPSVSSDVPYNFDLDWSLNSKLRDVVDQFRMHVNKLQEFWSVLDEIDRSLWVTDRSISCRQIKIGNDCCLMLSINVDDPRSLPESRFLGSDTTTVNSLRNIWKRNCKKWSKEKSFAENLGNVFDTKLLLPQPEKNVEEQVECGICYTRFLPTDDELGAKSGSETDYRCENGSCNQAFHSVCLIDWLRSITTTRQSFDVLFGSCPYCSDPIALKIGTVK
ncbi:hypothetical protein CASFOL_017039 [Castilleja foliolosa]|uniref:E3 ubiquitin-protein ligase FANCL n=1 Tax=Castilleja foliolosa TaxID=1961234 RepID=A0ABD3DAV4_9LAMI